MEKVLDFTILEINQIFDNNKVDNKRLEIFKKYGVTASITDFAILLGGCVDAHYKTDGKRLENRNGWYWSKTLVSDNPSVVSYDGRNGQSYVNYRNDGCRPASSFSSISEISLNGVRGKNGLLEVEYGEYPQKVASKRLQAILNKEYLYGSLKLTGRSYTVDSRKDNEFSKGFLEQKYDEFEYEGKKYVRVIANTFYSEKVTLSNREKYQDGNIVWVEVGPIKWFVDEKENIIVAKYILFAGIQFNDKAYDGDFSKTTLKWYLDNFFSKEIIPSKQFDKPKQEIVTNQSFEEKLISEIREQLEKISEHENVVQNIKLRVNSLLDEYNEKVSMTKRKSLLMVSDETIEGLRKNCIFELKLILDEVKGLVNSLKLFYEIRDYLNDLLKILNKEEIEFNSELKKDFNIISNHSIPFLNEEEQVRVKKLFVDIIENELKKNNDVILQIVNGNKINNQNYTTLNEFELYIRKLIHPILEVLYEKVLKFDAARRILEGTNEIIRNNYKINQTTTINRYLNVINKIYSDIKEKYNLSEEENNRLIGIIKININQDLDINEIVNQLNEVINQLFDFKFDLQELVEEKMIIENSYIKTRL